jgi:diguanylate cyclase
MADLQATLRGPGAYKLGAKVLALMEHHKVWPTAVNYELWLNYAADPKGRIGLALDRMINDGTLITEAVTDALAASYLPRLRINDQIRDAGDQLSRELGSVSGAIENAKHFNEAYGEMLTKACENLAAGPDPTSLQDLVEGLSEATRKARRQNIMLSDHLRDSTLEVSRMKEHLEIVRRDSMTDALTSLANRKCFEEQLVTACDEAERTGGLVTLALLDIDHFKRFNDTWGHQTGDQVLRYVASIIGRQASPPRLAARYGGEEFALLAPAEGGDRLAVALEIIREGVAGRRLKRRSTDEELGAVTVSAGYAQRRPGEGTASLIERADAALYASKRGGRNQVTNADAPATRAAA